MNALNGKVQIFPPIADYDHTSNIVVWYSPASFPTVETHADLVDGDGDLLLVSNGWQLKVICVQQLTRPPHPARVLTYAEMRDIEAREYEQASS